MSDLKYGIVGSSQIPPQVLSVGGFLASDVLSAKSGRFVVYDDSDNYWRACNDGENKIAGYVEQSLTCSATSGGTKLSIIDVRGLTFELPYATAGNVTTALTQAVLDDLIGKTCDLAVSANIQYADGGATTDNIFRIVGGNINQGAYGTLYVQVLDASIGYIA